MPQTKSLYTTTLCHHRCQRVAQVGFSVLCFIISGYPSWAEQHQIKYNVLTAQWVFRLQTFLWSIMWSFRLKPVMLGQWGQNTHHHHHHNHHLAVTIITNIVIDYIVEELFEGIWHWHGYSIGLVIRCEFILREAINGVFTNFTEANFGWK